MEVESDADIAHENDTWGVETLAGANYQLFDDIVDQVAARRGARRVELRDALGHWVDNDLEAAVEEYDVTESVITHGAAACERAVVREYDDLSAGEIEQSETGGGAA